MTCLERIECIKAAMPPIMMLGCMAGVALILLGHLQEYAQYIDKLIGTIMVLAGLHSEQSN